MIFDEKLPKRYLFKEVNSQTELYLKRDIDVNKPYCLYDDIHFTSDDKKVQEFLNQEEVVKRLKFLMIDLKHKKENFDEYF